MRTIVSNLFMSLDGVVESPQEWHLQYFSPEMGDVLSAGMAQQNAYLLGRHLYDEWSQYWPAHIDDDPFGRYITGLDKYVLTHRPLDGEPWDNTTVLGADPVAEVQALKAQGDGQIGMSGCPSTVRWLLENGLLDELNLLLDPIVVGRGMRLFEGAGSVPLTLASSADLPNGVLHLRYTPVAG